MKGIRIKGIISVDSLNYELENYVNKIIDEELVGSEYRDRLELSKMTIEKHVAKLSASIEKGKTTISQYLGLVLLGQKSQENLLIQAQEKKASKTTVQRIKKRLELMKEEVNMLKENGAEVVEENPESQNPNPQEKPSPKEPVKEQPKEVKPVEVKEPPKKKYIVPEAKLEKLSQAVNSYMYLALYWRENRMNIDKSLMIKVDAVRKLFHDPYKINGADYEKAMDDLPEVKMEMVAGLNENQRSEKIEGLLEAANEAFENIKKFGCTKDEAISTAETIKYLNKIKDIPNIPCPEIKVAEIEKPNITKPNVSIEEHEMKFTIIKAEGALGHRSLWIKYSLNYNGEISGVTQYVRIGLYSTTAKENGTIHISSSLQR